MVDFSGRVSSPSTSPVIVPFAAMDEEELFERNSLAQSMSINLDFSDEETDDEHPLLRAYKGLNLKYSAENRSFNCPILALSSQFLVTPPRIKSFQNFKTTCQSMHALKK